MAVLIVPRGETAEFYEFLSLSARANGVDMVIDRRHRKRRRAVSEGVGKRLASDDRRGPVPQRWERDGLIVVDDSPQPE